MVTRTPHPENQEKLYSEIEWFSPNHLVVKVKGIRAMGFKFEGLGLFDIVRCRIYVAPWSWWCQEFGRDVK